MKTVHGGLLKRAAVSFLFAIPVLVSGGCAEAHGRIDSPRPSPEAACTSLQKRLVLRDTRIDSTEVVSGPAFTPPGAAAALTNLPQFCRVVGSVAPSINFEVWLPLKNWNGKFNGVGGGGFAGVISYDAMADALRRGYGTASTDTGHLATDVTWLANEGQLRDYGYRAIREMTLKGKAVLTEFYNKEPRYSYFTGCSTGGRQGLMEAQRYPEDYDGILAGAPVFALIEDMLAQLWAGQANLNDPQSYVPPTKWPLVTAAVLARCDAYDGVKDGVLENPRACDFDPAILQCAAGHDEATCFTSAQVETIRKIYKGPSRPSTGKRLSFGYEKSSEVLWSLTTAGPGPFIVPDLVTKITLYKDPNYDFRTFDFDAGTDLMFSQLGEIWDATNVDMRAAERRGAKVILYHGWDDWGIPPGNTIEYYQRVKALMASRHPHDQSHEGRGHERHDSDDFIRLFMLPGVGHCAGGAGPDQFDGLAALERWVERGDAPESMVASHLTNGAVDKTRPLCPYPKEAVYRGKGDTNSAASFSCRVP